MSGEEPRFEIQKTTQDSLCLKCGKSITHNIPYKYEGKTFHARCLVCNYCGRNLVGKPFHVENQNIFCGETCKQGFETNSHGESTDDTYDEKRSTETLMKSPLNESLIEALDSINEGSKPLSMLHSVANTSAYDPDQITDYPRHASPDTTSSRISLDGSIRSSLSAVSVSSLLSDYSYDANRKPAKKILKNPHRPHRRTKKNVRWNLQIGNDSDTMSLESFDSTSTSSSLFNRAKKGVNETRQKWREFESAPPPGSTGITPMKLSLAQGLLSRPNSAPHIYHGSPLSSYMPELEPTHEHIQSSFLSDRLNPGLTHPKRFTHSSSPQERLSSSPSQSITVLDSTEIRSRLYRTVAPLTSAPTSMIQESGFNNPSKQQYNDKESLTSSPGDHSAKEQLDLSDDIDSPLFLKMNDIKVSELEASTLEDRQRAHIYQFPVRSMNSINSASKRNTDISAFLDDDDRNDYDHLAPLDTNIDCESRNTQQAHTLITNMVTLRDNSMKKSDRKKLVSYTDDDIEDALKVIDSEVINSRNVHDENSEKPPPLPVKRGRIASTPAEEQYSAKVALHRSGSDPIKVNKAFSIDINEIKHAPPVPPKLNRKKGQAPPSALPSTVMHTQPAYTSMSQGSENSDENILPPPPEFAYHSSDSQKSSPKSSSDDVFNSASTSTLIAEQDLSSPTDYHTKIPYEKPSAPIHPVNIPSNHQKQFWMDPFPLKINDRIVVGAEDPQSPTENLCTPTHVKPLQSSVRNWQGGTTRSFSTKTGEHELKEIDYLETSNYKISVEAPFSENNILKHSHSTTFVHSNLCEKPKRVVHIPVRPAPLPPVSRKTTSEARLNHFPSERGQQLGRQEFSPAVEELLSNLNIATGEQEKHRCVVCNKAILSPRECITFNNKTHHTKCFSCSKCHSLFYNMKPYSYKNTRYFCQDCCNKSSFMAATQSNYRDYHRPASGGQITTV